jgi:hypothetical protein
MFHEHDSGRRTDGIITVCEELRRKIQEELRGMPRGIIDAGLE